MERVTINHVRDAPTGKFRARSDRGESTGDTPGAALDALTAGSGQGRPARLVVVIELAPDDSFTAEQRRRLDELKDLYRLASAGQASMSAAERDEMEASFDALFAASERNAEAMGDGPAA